MVQGTRYVTKEAVLKRAQEAVGIPLRDIDIKGRLANGKDKGSVGIILEEGWFGYDANGEARADFPEAGVELKVTPYVRNSAGIRAKDQECFLILNGRISAEEGICGQSWIDLYRWRCYYLNRLQVSSET